jgi:hypothetical protein
VCGLCLNKSETRRKTVDVVVLLFGASMRCIVHTSMCLPVAYMDCILVRVVLGCWREHSGQDEASLFLQLFFVVCYFSLCVVFPFIFGEGSINTRKPDRSVLFFFVWKKVWCRLLNTWMEINKYTYNTYQTFPSPVCVCECVRVWARGCLFLLDNSWELGE